MTHQERTFLTERFTVFFSFIYIDCLTKKMLKHASKIVAKYTKHERKKIIYNIRTSMTNHLKSGYVLQADRWGEH